MSDPSPAGGLKAVCPVCDADGAAPIESYRDPVGGKTYDLLECPGCSLVFARPLLFPGADWYGKYNYSFGQAETSADAGKMRFPYFLDRLPEPEGRRLLDVGCSGGHFLRLAAERGYDVEGLDVDARCVELVRGSGLTGVRQGVLDEEFARAHAGRYDVVSIMEVLEHVDDPRGFLARAGRILKPGGRLLISVPDNRRPTPFGRDVWDYPPHHLTRWKPDALRLALERSGLVVEDQSSTPLPAVDFSRVWADRSARWILSVIKRVLFGRGAARRPMDDLLAGPAPAGRASALPDKSRRQRLVYFYHSAFNAAAYPVFALLVLYYRFARPDAGHTLQVIARKPGPGEGR